MKNSKGLNTIKRKEILKAVREKGNLDQEVEDMNLPQLRKLHQILFEEAVRTGKEKFGKNFDISVLRRTINNTPEHMKNNVCPKPLEFCNRKNCDYYAPDCVANKIKGQIDSLILEILEPSSVGPWIQSKIMW